MAAPAPFDAELAAARTRSDALFSTLRPRAWLARPVAERHRLVFYLGHLEAFDWNLLVRGPPLDERLEKLFAFGIDPLEDLPIDQPADWPPLDEIHRWSTAARAQVDARTGVRPIEQLIAVEHRLMHVETLSYLFEQLEPGLREAPAPEPETGVAPAQAWLEIPAGPVELGRRRSGGQPGWCNEFEGHQVQVPAFAIEARKTTNGDWLAFLEADGYRDPRLWTDADWAWREAEGILAPQSWRRRGHQGWTLWVNGHELPLPSSWPVYVSQAEARAYAKFRGARLPTEAEWHRAVHGTPSGLTREYPWGDEAPRPGLHGNFGFAHLHATRVGAHPAGASAFGLDEPVGNGWEWTATPFAPFEGFERLALYPGYSEPFFDGRHFVLAGASAATALPLLRRSFRNWYQPHYRPVFSTLRLARERP